MCHYLSDRKSFTATLNGQPGNAVVAIYDMEDPDAEDATILWSYHIWVTGDCRSAFQE